MAVALRHFPRSGSLLLSAFGGFAMFSAFPDLSWWPMSIFALALLFSRVDGAGFGWALVNTVVFAVCWWMPLVSWVPLATGTWLPWVALAVTQVCALCLWTVCVKLVEVWQWAHGLVGKMIIYPLSWVGIEQLRSHYPWSGFPWGNVAMPQVDSPLGRLAPWGGEVLVSFVVAVLAMSLRCVLSSLDGPVRLRGGARAGLIVLLVGVCAGCWMIRLPLAQEAGAIRIGVVQGDVELPGSLTFAEEGKVAENNERVSKELGAHGGAVDLAVWGETGADRDPHESTIVSRSLESASLALGAPILFGYANVRENQRWNWLGVWDPQTGLVPDVRYAKQKPVPFGEFIPWRSFVSALATEAAQVNIDMAAADNPGIMSVPLGDGRRLRVAVGICFESAYSSVIGEGVRMGGQIIITPSNNYHFRTSAESAQQAQFVRFRAMEFSRSAIQASTTGRSVMIRPDGSILAQTEPQSSAWLAESMPLRTSMTLAARLGELPAHAVMVAVIVLAIAAIGARIPVQRTIRETTRARAAGKNRIRG